MEFRFGTVSIVEIGTFLSRKLTEDGITKKAELFVYVSDDEFKKIDEDLYYRNKRGDEENFVPSDDEIIVNFDMVRIIIKRDNEATI